MKFVCAILAVLVLSGTTTAAKEADEQTKNKGYSGMSRLTNMGSKAEYLVVHDRKDMEGHKDYAWLGIVTVTWPCGKPTSAWKPLTLHVPTGEAAPNDLEACCRVPGPGNRFLVAESDYWRSDDEDAYKYGRVILISLHLQKSNPPTWTAQWEQSFTPRPPPAVPQDKSRHIEGMDCVSLGGGKLALVLSTLGLKGKSGQILWGALDLSAPKPFDLRGSRQLTPGSGPLNERSCAALFLKPSGGGQGHYVWSAATVDPGDVGPFRSQIFLAGTLRRVRGKALFRYCMRSAPVKLWDVGRIKVEAMARPPTGMPRAGLAIASDDEDFIGVWRTLPSRK